MGEPIALQRAPVAVLRGHRGLAERTHTDGNKFVGKMIIAGEREAELGGVLPERFVIILALRGEQLLVSRQRVPNPRMIARKTESDQAHGAGIAAPDAQFEGQPFGRGMR